MKVVVQRVSSASVEVEGCRKGQIGHGLVVLAGFEASDTEEDIRWIARKLPQLRIFDDAGGNLNLSLREIGGEILLVSQFTLFANVKKGTRPSYNKAAPPAVARPLYERAVQILEEEVGKAIVTGEFAASMRITLTNDGPVTILIDSRNRG
jgi:D-aminoacyl-tRNA deacylase